MSLISQASGGQAAAGWSYRPALSADGRTVAFASSAADLVPGDSNGAWDVFARDLSTGQLTRVSETASGVTADGSSGSWSSIVLSANGRYAAFASLADNLVPGDRNIAADVFLKDRQTGALTLVSHNLNGSPADGWSDWPAISADGRYVTFTSLATNLVSTPPPGRTHQIYRFDRETGEVKLVSLTSTGAPAAQGAGWASAVSADGAAVVFTSQSQDVLPTSPSRFWQVYLRDLKQGQTLLVSRSLAGAPGDRSSGYPGSLAISDDGNLVAFASQATNLVNEDTNEHTDVFVWDRGTGLVRRSSVDTDGTQAAGDCFYPAISPEGRYVSFTCLAGVEKGDDNGAWDVFLRDRLNHVTLRLSTAPGLKGGNQHSGLWGPSPVSADGRSVAFASAASNLAGGDRNANWDVYLADLALLRGERMVAEARKDIGMPYCTILQSDTRACGNGSECGGPYHGFYCGVCTDVVIDAANAGGGVDLVMAQSQDMAEHPDHRYEMGGARSANDLWLYFRYTGQTLPAGEPYRPGDAVFFDWNQDGWVEHVALVSQVTADGQPKTLLDAPGELKGNPGGLANEFPWQPFEADALVGRARLGGTTGILPQIGS
jgi:Tol biopolymer transport system component